MTYMPKAQSDRVSPAALLSSCPVYKPTPLLDLPRLAAVLGVASVLAKDEGSRPLGSFKALGGVYAGLCALSRASGLPVAALIEREQPTMTLPTLVCASDGNHGLAVAAAARLAGTTARVFLPAPVPNERVARIASKGAEIVRVPGTYDDAVRAARAATQQANTLLIADTSDNPNDVVVAEVMAGYGVIAEEVRSQIAKSRHTALTHIFVQAGVGGLAAAVAAGLHSMLATPAWIVAVEPETAACVAAALLAGQPVTVPGSLDTVAEMLSCGEASASALTILSQHRAYALPVSEAALRHAPTLLVDHGGPVTTASGAAGLAGLRIALADRSMRNQLGLGPTSRVLLFVTEAPYG